MPPPPFSMAKSPPPPFFFCVGVKLHSPPPPLVLQPPPPLERIGPWCPLLIIKLKGDKKGQKSEKFDLEAVWKELLRGGWT